MAAATQQPAFSAASVFALIESFVSVPRAEATDPLDSLDALMAALNLVRLLLTRAATPPSGVETHAALEPAARQRLEHQTLKGLDEWLRIRMDALWAEIGAAERRTPPPECLESMRVSFTHLHVATDVVTRSLELCRAFPPAKTG